EVCGMIFAHPQWLWALLVLPLFYLIMIWNRAQRRRRLASFADPALWPRLLPELDWGAPLRKGLIWILAFGFGIVALANPEWGRHEQVVHLNGLDIMVVLDVSNSMYVEDVVPSRLESAKHFVTDFLERLEGDRVGIVAFAASSYVASPLTTDLDYIRENLAILSPKMVHNQGTDIGLGLETAGRALARGAEESGTAPNQQALKSKAVVLIS